MPRLAEVWHHRTFDMTTVRTLFELEKPDHAHRALQELRADAAMLRTVRDQLCMEERMLARALAQEGAA